LKKVLREIAANFYYLYCEPSVCQEGCGYERVQTIWAMKKYLLCRQTWHIWNASVVDRWLGLFQAAT